MMCVCVCVGVCVHIELFKIMIVVIQVYTNSICIYNMFSEWFACCIHMCILNDFTIILVLYVHIE
jgi:hypothetical protein